MANLDQQFDSFVKQPNRRVENAFEEFVPKVERPISVIDKAFDEFSTQQPIQQQSIQPQQPQLDIPTPPREFGGQALLPRPQQQPEPDAFFDGVDVGTPPVQAVQPTAEELNRPSELTRRALESIDETFGVAKSPLSDPTAPLTKNQQKFEQQSEIGKLASTAGRTLARAGTGVATFIPNVILFTAR